ncbi:MAG: hypothetical protein KC636_09180 [Myxococcales bacterium]|nr:hypothetical protein [Myxococcales bacterium]
MADRELDLRDARDRVIDLLGFGETYPLRDAQVSDGLKVPFETPAVILIAPAQEQVEYELRDHNGDGPPGDPDGPLRRLEGDVATPVTAIGAGPPVELRTPAVVEDATFTILARKAHALDGGERSLREVFLRRRARVKVGLDATLPARVRLQDGVTLLIADARDDGAPRLIDYGGTVRVDIDGAQEGVEYELVTVEGGELVTRSAAKVRGRGPQETITIATTTLREDCVLRVRAHKTFDMAAERDATTELLTATLPVCVRADPSIEVAAPAVVDYAQPFAVQLATSQASARYQLFSRSVLDRELRRDGVEARDTVTAAPGDGAPLSITRPEPAAIWSTPDRFAPVADELAGTGGALALPAGGLQRDAIYLVRARKQHGEGASRSEAVPLRAAVAILTRPDPRPALALRVTLVGDATDGGVTFLGGQPGVRYTLRRAPGGEVLGAPAYVHKRDAEQPAQNKGIGQVALSIDFVVARDVARPNAALEPAMRPPAPARVDTGALEVGARLTIEANVAQTGLAAELAGEAVIDAAPEIRAEPAAVAEGAPVSIVIAASVVGERYQLTLDGQPIGAPVDGTGEALALASQPLTARSRLAVLLSRPGAAGIAVEREVAIDVAITP